MESFIKPSDTGLATVLKTSYMYSINISCHSLYPNVSKMIFKWDEKIGS